jgi:hypothetical protein
MKRLLTICSLILFATVASAQPPVPKAGPEHEMLKKLVGKWDMTSKMMGQEAKGVAEYKMELGGLWLTSTVNMDMFGMKFEGRGMDSYDANKKKYTSVWVDNMITSPISMEGTFDAATKTLTMVGDGPGPDGKIIKNTIKTKWTSDNAFEFAMYHGDAKDAAFTISYTRKK